MRKRIATSLIVTLVASIPILAQDLEVLHMWRTDSEQHALAALKDPLVSQGFEWADYWVNGNFQGVQSELSRRISIGDPPTAIQWIVGDELNDLVDENIIRLIPETDTKYSEFYQPEIYELVEVEGSMSALPVGIHTQNHIVYNKNMLEKFGLTPAESWDELISYGPILAEEGVNLLATSDQNWQIRNLGMAVFSSLLTREEFLILQRQGGDLDQIKDKVHKAVTILSQIRKYSHNGSHDLNWEEASKKVVKGEALAQVLGDYIIPQFPVREEIVCAVSPQAKYILWGVDSFVFPVSEDPNVTIAQDAFIKVATDPQNIREYVLRKGGIPVTTNIQPEELDECIGSLLTDWNMLEDKLWTGGDAWRNRLEVLGIFLAQQWEEGFGDIDASADKLISLLYSVD